MITRWAGVMRFRKGALAPFRIIVEGRPLQAARVEAAIRAVTA